MHAQNIHFQGDVCHRAFEIRKVSVYSIIWHSLVFSYLNSRTECLLDFGQVFSEFQYLSVRVLTIDRVPRCREVTLSDERQKIVEAVNANLGKSAVGSFEHGFRASSELRDAQTSRQEPSRTALTSRCRNRRQILAFS